MDEKTTIEKLKKQVQNFCEERDWTQYHQPKELAIGLVTESAELLDLFRFKNAQQQEELLNNKEKRERGECICV